MMNPIKTLCLIGQITWLVLAAGPALAEETLPILNTGSQTFTNVVVVNVSATHLFFRHAGGAGSVKLKELTPELQKKYGYDPVKGESIERSDRLFDLTGEGSQRSLTSAVPAGFILKDYPLRNTGTLRLGFPKTWSDSIVQSPAEYPPSTTIRLEHTYSGGFVVFVSTLPKDSPFQKMDTKAALAIPGNHALGGSVETTLELKPLNGAEIAGYYFTLTDKTQWGPTPPAGKYQYQTQGLVKLGDLTISFSIQFNSKESKDPEAALEMMRMAQFTVKP